MAVYTVHVDRTNADPASAFDGMILIPEKFSFAAFLLGPVWLVYRRLWLALAAWLIGFAVLATAAILAGLGSGGLALIYGSAGLLLGMEGNTLRRWRLERQGYVCIDIASGANVEEAERRALTRCDAAAPADWTEARSAKGDSYRPVRPGESLLPLGEQS